MARETWTDERLDDLANRMDKGFDEVKGEVKELRSEMNGRFAAVEARFDSMQRAMIIGFVTLNASVIGGLFAVITMG
ncbi:MAG TPA: hypothetical protein VJU14_01495 [Solirubrobacterales bacterium]|nr:hypothetical protein [Solirubrobacterales bacterium]